MRMAIFIVFTIGNKCIYIGATACTKEGLVEVREPWCPTFRSALLIVLEKISSRIIFLFWLWHRRSTLFYFSVNKLGHD